MLSNVVNWVGRLLQSIVLLLLPIVGPSLRPDDHNILRYYAAINRIVQPVMHQVFLTLRPQNGKTIKELLFDINGYSNTKYKKTFSEGERNKLDNNESSKEFDITFLYKLLQLLCGLADTNDNSWSDPGSLENSLKQLKDHRNILAHEDISFTSEELQEKINHLEELCRNVLNATGLLTEITEMEKGMQEVLLGGIDLWEPYRNALNELRNKKTSVLIREGRKDVRKLGKNLKILNPFAWLFDSNYSHLDVEHIFTDLEMEGTQKIETKNILICLLPTNELPDSTVISGPPGIGKTSVFRFLVQDWLSTNPTVLGMETIELVLPVELRHVQSSDVKDLLKYEILRNVAQHLEIDDILSCLNNISLLWLLDGYDEANWKTKKVVKEILKMFPNSRVIVTSRTEFIQEIKESFEDVHRFHMSINLKGLSETNIRTCAKKFIDASVQHSSEKDNILRDFLEYMNKENRIKLDVFMVPLFLAILVMLWLDDPQKITDIKTLSALYYQLIEHIIRKLLVRNSYRELNQRKFITEQKINAFLDELGKLLFKRDTELSLKEYEVKYLVDLCLKLGLPFTDTMSAFFVCAERPTQTGFREDYTIIHRSVMEFLIARAFCNQMISNDSDVMKTAEDWFTSKRETLLKNEPQNPELKTTYDFKNLSKDLPSDIFQRFREKRFIMSSNDFFCSGGFCNTCKKDIRKRDYFWKKTGNNSKMLTSKNFWYHISDNVFGMRRIYIVGYLSIKQELNERRCEQLAFYYFKFSGFGGGDIFLWNLVVKEANSELFNNKFFKYISKTMLVFYSDNYSDIAKELITYVTPKAVFLHYCFGKYTSNGIEYTKEAGKILLTSIRVFMKHPIEIHLDLSYFLLSYDEGVSFAKNCLELLLDERSLCKLVTVRCPVNMESLQMLRKASHLRELIVRLDGKDLPRLAELVKELPCIERLSVAVDPSSFSGIELPVLIPDDRNISMEFFVLINAFNTNSQRVASDIKRLCSNPCNVVLHGNLDDLDLDNLLTCVHYVVNTIQHLTTLDIFVDPGGTIKFLQLESIMQIMRIQNSKTITPINFYYFFRSTFTE